MHGSPAGSLERSLGTGSAALLGLGSIFGTGVFVAIGLGVDLAGYWIVPAIVLAGLVAACNALSSAELAAAFPVSGGTYEYGYRLLHPLAGFSAGWLFLLAKSASAAGAALGAAAYGLRLFGQDDPRIIVATGLVLVLAVTLLVLSGLRRSNMANTLIVALTLIALLAFVIAALPDTGTRLRTIMARRRNRSHPTSAPRRPGTTGSARPASRRPTGGSRLSAALVSPSCSQAGSSGARPSPLSRPMWSS